MSIWDGYTDRIEALGGTKRNAAYNRESNYITRKLVDNLSYQEVNIDGVSKRVAIINSDNLNEKKILSWPGETLKCGSMVDWMNNHWLLTELDANDTIYMRGKLLQCNHLLKWVSDDHVIHQQWCVVEDGTKLKHYQCNSLVCRKRHAKRTPLIAGSSLEHCCQSGTANSRKRNGLKSTMIG